MILPEELRYYYNDNISFKTENDPYMALSRFGLINIDEFDALSANKHPMLKYILSKSDAKYRPPYGKAIEHHQRFASFIATTNCQRPLLDQTGSRRFVGIKTDEIDFNPERNYTQIYAQIVAEIKAGKPYYFNEEDNKRVMKSNLPFMSVNDYTSIVKYLFNFFAHTLLFNLESFLYILWIEILCQYMFANISSWPVTCLFTFLIVSFEV